MIDVSPNVLRLSAIWAGAIVAIVAALTGVDGVLLVTAGALVGFGIGLKTPSTLGASAGPAKHELP